MYLEHFGLDAPPFKITPDPQLFYSGGERGLLLEALVYAISQGEGMIKVVGEVGSGKTMLCRMLPERLPAHVELLYLANPRLTPDTILHAIALEMRLPIAAQTHANHLQVMQALHQALLDKHANNQQVVLLIEEAQGMPLETLEEIRLLSNLETTQHKLLQIVLFGQPELDVNLAGQGIRQLRERITHSFYLSPLSRQGVAEYLDFRMRAVGYRGPSVFAKSAIAALHRYAQGLLRRANILADKALLAAFAEGSHAVLAKHVKRAAQDSGFCKSARRPWLWFAVLTLLLLLSVAALWQIGLSQGGLRVLPSMLAPWAATALKLPLADARSGNFSEVTSSLPNPELLPLPFPSPSPTPAQASLLQQRLLASRAWLRQAQGNAYTIQLMQVEMGDRIHRVLDKTEMQALQHQLYVVPNAVPVARWRLFYGTFGSYTAAQAALQQLPATLQSSQPFVRDVKTLGEHLSDLAWDHVVKETP